MAQGINKVIILGRVGKDPQISTFQNGGIQARFSLATTETWTDKPTGNKMEHTSWHPITANGRMAEIVRDYVKKGDMIYVEGKNKYGEYEKDGRKIYTHDVLAMSLQMLGSPSGNQSNNSQPNQTSQNNAYAAAQAGSPPPVQDVADDDLPF